MSNTYSPLPQNPNKKNQNKKAYIAVAGVAVVLILSVAGVALTLNKGDVNTPNTKDTAKQTSSLGQLNGGNGGNASTAAQSGLLSSDGRILQEKVSKLDPETKTGRESLDKYLQEAGASANNINLETISQIPKSASTPTFKVGQSKKVKITIKYNSVGDKDFAKGTLFIKLDKGLKLVAGSLKDSFNGQQEVAVADSVYDAGQNVISYGPGTKDKSVGQIKVGEKGVFTLVLEKDADAQDLAVRSFIKDENGKGGKPGIMFIES